MSCLTVMSHCHVSPHLTSLAPQSAHRTRKIKRFPSSAWIDRIFRNEKVGGSNPVSSTKMPWSGRFLGRRMLVGSTILSFRAPQRAHGISRHDPLIFCEVIPLSATTEPRSLTFPDPHRWRLSEEADNRRIDPSAVISRGSEQFLDQDLKRLGCPGLDPFGEFGRVEPRLQLR